MSTENLETLETATDAFTAGSYRFYGLRALGTTQPAIGDQLPNSWHNASDCDWVDEDTELDGACAFEVRSYWDGNDQEIGVGRAVQNAQMYWPDESRFALVASNIKGDGEVPEDGGFLLRSPVVIAIFEA